MKKGILNAKKPFKIVALVLAFIITFVGGFFFSYLFKDKKSVVSNELITIIESVGYVIDPETGEQRELTEADYANAITNGLLDEYSRYFTAQEYQTYLNELNGEMSGFGISFYSGTNILAKVIGNSPACFSGLEKRDKIVALSVNGNDRREISNSDEFSEFVSKLEKGTAVTFHVQRDGQSEEEIILTAREYQASYVTYFDSENSLYFRSESGNPLAVKEKKINSEFDCDTSYIKLDQFSGNAHGQLKEALEFMKENGRTKLVLDMRSNGGGSVRIMCEIASYLLYSDGEKPLVQITKNRNDSEYYYANSGKFYSNITSMSVILDGNSASATEALTGALLCNGKLLNHDKVVIVKNSDGVGKSFGKGIMQTSYRLLSGGAFKITTAKVYWPDGVTSIHGKGIIANSQNAVGDFEALGRAISVL